jgi:hypothetical protein
MKMAEYTGFELSGYDRNNSSDFESFEYSVPRNAHDAVFRKERTYRSVIEDDTDLISDKQMINDKMVVGEDKPHQANKDFNNFLKTSIKEGSKYIASETEIVTESLTQHKYAHLAESSYNYFNSRGKLDAVHDVLSSPDNEYIDDLNGFSVDKELSTIDNLVLHNESSGETHISYRGTTDRPLRTKSFLRDWKVNGQITGGSTHTSRVRQADRQFGKIVNKYGKKNLTASGHSQGGHVSYEMAVKHDIPGYHFNPAINTTQLSKAKQFAANESEQTVYKTITDFASPLAYSKELKKSNTKVKIVQNVEGLDGLVETHSIDQFKPKPVEIEGALVKSTRRTIAGSVIKSAGKLLDVVNIGYAGYLTEQDIEKDVNKKDAGAGEKAFDVSVDVGKNAEKFVADTAIAGVGISLAPETFGASAVLSIGVIAVNDYVVDHVADEAKSLAHSAKKTGNKIASFFGF